ncbi:MAG: PAS domain S-box protein [Methanomicrobium sp.]|nr:PAS domain S-box protein [Methanomicrobium sp.]
MRNKISSANLRFWTENQSESPDVITDMIINSISDPLFILSTQGVILLCNTACEEFLKMSVSEIKGHHCYELVHKLNDFTEGCPFVRSMKSKKREAYKANIDGKWSLVTIDPLINGEEDVVGAIHFIKDIDNIVRLDAAKTNLVGLVENTVDAVASVLLDDTIKYWNLGAEDIFGYTEEEIIGKNARILIAKEGMPHYDEIKKRIKAGEKIPRFESKMIAKSGEKIDVSISVQPMYDERGVVIGNSFIANNLTPQRKAEQELLHYVTEGTMRLEKPIEIIERNLSDIKILLSSGKLDSHDLELLLDVQISNAGQIYDNLKELKKEIADKQKDLPDEHARFLNE